MWFHHSHPQIKKFNFNQCQHLILEPYFINRTAVYFLKATFYNNNNNEYDELWHQPA